MAHTEKINSGIFWLYFRLTVFISKTIQCTIRDRKNCNLSQQIVAL